MPTRADATFKTVSVELLDPIRIRVPFETIPKSRPRVTPGGVFTPSSTEEDAVATYLARHGPTEPWEFPVGLVAVFHRATQHVVDVDNLLKLIMDAANKIVYDDDRRVEFVQSMIVRDGESYTDLLFGRLKD